MVNSLHIFNVILRILYVGNIKAFDTSLYLSLQMQMLAAKARSCSLLMHGWQITQKAQFVAKKSK